MNERYKKTKLSLSSPEKDTPPHPLVTNSQQRSTAKYALFLKLFVSLRESAGNNSEQT